MCIQTQRQRRHLPDDVRYPLPDGEVVKTYDADPEGIAKAVNSTGWVMLGAEGRQN